MTADEIENIVKSMKPYVDAIQKTIEQACEENNPEVAEAGLVILKLMHAWSDNALTIAAAEKIARSFLEKDKVSDDEIKVELYKMVFTEAYKQIREGRSRTHKPSGG